MNTQLNDQPTLATAEDGEVMLDGPDGLAASFTPDAAARSAESIAAAAVKAASQADRSAEDDEADAN